ncbi:aromatic acid exporter family protein [Peribacillus saganii]|uniref:aromatic acid exporter family protein n=1 Tax=Peribacillus saganii TaxID=2303992 RepID=UPI0018F1F621|nr:aromatic acid exporter family protein [Peribacillus saganii]
MFKIGYRTIKTAIGTAAAITIAQWMGLNSFTAAGIIAILCIQVTKKQSLRASWNRFAACMIAMGLSAIFFEGIAFHPAVIGILLLLFIPVTVAAKIKDGIVTSSVIILHFYSAGNVTLELFINETALIIVGIGVALIMNLYMPSVEIELSRFQEEIEKKFEIILKEIVVYLKMNDSSWGGKEITEASKLIGEAKSMALRDVENHFLRNEDDYYHYFRMREKQFEILERILQLVTSIPSIVKQSGMIADFLEEISNNVHPHNTAHIYLKQLNEMRVEFQFMALPKTREEFESRAALVQLMKEIEEYLNIKNSSKPFPVSRVGMKRKSPVKTKQKA